MRLKIRTYKKYVFKAASIGYKNDSHYNFSEVMKSEYDVCWKNEMQSVSLEKKIQQCNFWTHFLEHSSKWQENQIYAFWAAADSSQLLILRRREFSWNRWKNVLKNSIRKSSLATSDCKCDIVKATLMWLPWTTKIEQDLFIFLPKCRALSPFSTVICHTVGLKKDFLKKTQWPFRAMLISIPLKI